MTKEEFAFIAVSELRLGLTIDLDVGWLKHPFPKSRFKISSPKQIEILQTLGLQRVRYVPSLSDAALSATLVSETTPESAEIAGSGSPGATEKPDVTATVPSQTAHAGQATQAAEAQQARQLACEQHFSAASAAYREVQSKVLTAPIEAGHLSRDLVTGLVDEMLGHGELAIRLLQKPPADPQAMHPVNVTVLSLLLGKALGLPQSALNPLGIAAFLHDIGKQQLPERLRWFTDNLRGADIAHHQEHAAFGADLAREMGFDESVLKPIAQHHEMCDGSGYPLKLNAQALGTASRILSLVNQYDNLCNPPRVEAATTPHEALAVMFSRMKSRFDGAALAAFIRMMGVYPPGSMVQLLDDRYAMVVAVNSSRPLKPLVMVQEAGVSRAEALVLDLDQTPGNGIRRSLRPSVLPEAALEYFAPPASACFFFEPANQPVSPFQSI